MHPHKYEDGKMKEDEERKKKRKKTQRISDEVAGGRVLDYKHVTVMSTRKHKAISNTHVSLDAFVSFCVKLHHEHKVTEVNKIMMVA